MSSILEKAAEMGGMQEKVVLKVHELFSNVFLHAHF